MESNVSIDRCTYDTLSQKAFKYDQIIAYLFSTARLTYSKDDLRFDDDINTLLRLSEPTRYKNKLYELKKEEENVIASE